MLEQSQPSDRSRDRSSGDVVVTGVALRSALGDLDTTWTRLLAGETAVRSRLLFDQIPERPLAMIGDRPIEVTDLLDLTLADLLATQRELGDWRDCAVSIGSSRSMQRSWEAWHRWQLDQNGSGGLDAVENRVPHQPWLETLPHAPALRVARRLGSRGAVFAPMAACATGLWSIARAVLAIESGECERVIAGSVEAPISPLTIATFDRMGALSQSACRPFDRSRSGLVLGEGAALLLLESRQAATRRQAKILGRITSAGMTADAHHISAPDPNITAACAAVRQCLTRGDWRAESVDYIHLHGTGTQLNDRREAELVQTLFPQGVAVSSTKGATGHTIGASGAIGAVLCLQAIATQMMPPCVGTEDLEFELDLVRSARSSPVQRTLCFSFGFGGQNV
ncbi:MAG: beta-ketoacyl-ACP synthase, partial [Oscillatoriales cyanobacterium]